MAITVKKVELWNAVVDNKPGEMARVLEPLAEAGADLDIVMGTSIPGAGGKASIGVFPIKGKKIVAAAQAAGLAPARSMPSLLVSGENSVGLGRRLSEALATAGINVGVAVAQVLGPNFSAVFGFATEEDAAKAAALLKKAGAAKPSRKAGARAASPKRASASKKPASRKSAAKPVATKKPAAARKPAQGTTARTSRRAAPRAR